MNHFVRALALCGILAIAGAANSAAPRFAIARAPYHFVFPRDHGAHPDYQSEWWYFTGHLRDGSGRRFGYELTFFRAGLAPGNPAAQRGRSDWRGTQLYPAHLAITDEGGNTFVHFERLSRTAMRQGSAASGTLEVHSGPWWLRGNGPMHMHAERDGIVLDLDVSARKPPAIHGHDGVSRKASCLSCASHYYSLTNLQTRGTLRYSGATFKLEGNSWMDHEFGSDELQADQAGWDWFALQLADGREVMLYRLRQKSGATTPQSSGSIIERDGRVRYVARNEFLVEPQSFWKSPHSGGKYPSTWRISIPSAHLELIATPVMADQELAASDTSNISYWEGAHTLRDAQSGAPLGRAYIEMTGYSAPISL